MKIEAGDLVKVRVRIIDGRGDKTTSRVERITEISMHQDGYYVLETEPTSIKDVR